MGANTKNREKSFTVGGLWVGSVGSSETQLFFFWPYEKSSLVTYPFYFINRQPILKTNCLQIIKKILMREVFPAIARKINKVYTSGNRQRSTDKFYRRCFVDNNLKERFKNS